MHHMVDMGTHQGLTHPHLGHTLHIKGTLHNKAILQQDTLLVPTLLLVTHQLVILLRHMLQVHCLLYYCLFFITFLTC